MMAGNLLAVLTYIPIYRAMKAFSEPLNPTALVLLVFIQGDEPRLHLARGRREGRAPSDVNVLLNRFNELR
jgi:hypothetical protein